MEETRRQLCIRCESRGEHQDEEYRGEDQIRGYLIGHDGFD